MVSSPFEDGKGSVIWFLGPLALISSLVVPQFFLGNAIEAFLRDEILAGDSTVSVWFNLVGLSVKSLHFLLTFHPKRKKQILLIVQL